MCVQSESHNICPLDFFLFFSPLPTLCILVGLSSVSRNHTAEAEMSARLTLASTVILLRPGWYFKFRGTRFMI